MAIKFLNDINVTGSVTSSAGLTLSGLSAQNSEATALMINSSGVVGTRELGSGAFGSGGGGLTATQGGGNRVAHFSSATNLITDSGFTYASNVLTTEGLKITSVGEQSSEASSLMIDSNGVVGQRELGSNAFNSTTIPTISNNANNRVLTGDGTNANAEANLTFTGSVLTLTGSMVMSSYIYHEGDSDTFFGFQGNNMFKVRTGGTDRITVTDSSTTIGTSGVTLSAIPAVTATGYKAVVMDGSNVVSKSSATLGSNAFNSTTIPTDTVSSADINSYFKRGYSEESESATSLSAGWYTIAIVANTGNRAGARFVLWDTTSGQHQVVVFYAAHHYGTDGSNVLNVMLNSSYGGNGRFSDIRIKDGGTYTGAALQVYVDGTANVNFAIMDNVQSNGWYRRDWTPDATDPSGTGTGNLTSYSTFTVASSVDLDLISQGGIATTGPIYGDGDTTQYKHWNTNTFNFSGLANNRIVTGSSSTALNGEANLTFNGTALSHTGNYVNNSSASGQPNIKLTRASGLPSIKSSETNGYIIIDASGTGKVGINWYDDAGCTIGQGGGNLIVGTNTNNTEKLFVNGNCKINTALGVGVAPSSTSGTIQASNDITAFASSDIRLKNNLSTIDKALDKVKSLQGIEFDWIEDEEIHPNKGHDVGVIAQEVEKILPEIVDTRDNGYKAVKYEKIVPLLIEAIKDLSKQVDGLKRLI